MDENERNIVEDVELNKIEEVVEIQEQTLELSVKEQIEQELEKVKKPSEAMALYKKVKQALEQANIDENYYKYVENTLEDKIFCDAKFNILRASVLLEVVCPALGNIEDFHLENLAIETIGSHFEEQENYIDKICTYGHEFICLFGISEIHPDKVLAYQERKFTRQDMIEAVRAQYEEGKKIQLHQYDEYYIGIEEDRLKVFSERKITSLMKVEETPFDKIKSRIANFLNKNPFAKKKYLPAISLVYDTNPNRLKDFEHQSKFDARSRMKVLLNREREVTRNTSV
ncbi:MAG: hypothetical protein ACLU84_02620 [Clostridia bacterium]